MPDLARPTRRSVLSAAALAVPAAWLVTGGYAPAFARTAHRAAGARRVPLDQADVAGVTLAWHDLTNQVVNAAAYPEPVTQSRAWAVTWLAASRAIGRSHEVPFATAALAQAVHDTLAAQVPAEQATLDAALASTLAGVPEGRARSAGIAAGASAAARTLAERAGDGLDTASVDIPFTPPPPAPGVFELTPPTDRPVIRAGQGNARPFLLHRNDQFDPGAPYALTSRAYLRDLAEVRYIGETDSPRTDEQTEVALFWYPAINFAYVQITHALVAASSSYSSIGELARFVAAFNVITTDAQIATYNAKYKYLFWRPYTAITTGAVDPDPSWMSFQIAPQHPEYPSGHGGQIGSQQGVLDGFFGRRSPVPVALTSPMDPGVTRTYGDWQAMTDDVINARVWEGVHYRTSDEIGADLGYRVAQWELGQLGRLGI